MHTRKAPARHGSSKPAPPGSLLAKLRARGIVNTVAAFLGSGWLCYEIVHFILVEHYGLPEVLKDITIVGVVAAMLCTLCWQWFRGETGTRGSRWALVLISSIIVCAVAVDLRYILRDDDRGRTGSHADAPGSAWKNSIAVLPFVNMSAEREQEYFCDGLTEEMINRLSQIPGLKVTARTSTFVFKGESVDIREVGRRLGVEHVLEGSVRRDGARLRISAQLISVADGFHLWSQAYDRGLDRIFQTQDDIALSVASVLKLTLLGNQQPPPSRTASLEAYDEFLHGQGLYRNPTRENLEKAIAHFARAIELDPEYALAWAFLAGARAMQAGFGHVPVDVGFPNAMLAVDRALALDEHLDFAHSIKGWIEMSHAWDWAAADASYARALSLQPGRVPLGAAQLALALGDCDRAIRDARRAVDLDLLNATAHLNLAVTLFYCGRLDAARKSFSEVLDLSPDRANAHALLAQVYLLRSSPDKALAELEHESEALWRLPTQAMVLQALGRTRESRDALSRFIAEYQEGNAYQVAQVYAYLGDADQAFNWLETAYQRRDGGLFLIKPDPFLEPLRSDPRYSALLRKMGFSPGA